jgi:hypothetical protein
MKKHILMYLFFHAIEFVRYGSIYNTDVAIIGRAKNGIATQVRFYGYMVDQALESHISLTLLYKTYQTCLRNPEKCLWDGFSSHHGRPKPRTKACR